MNLFRAIPLVMVLLWFFLIVPRLLNCLEPGPRTHRRAPHLGDGGFALFSRRTPEIIRAGIQRRAQGARYRVGAGHELRPGHAPGAAPGFSATWSGLLLTQAIVLFLPGMALADFFGATPTRWATATGLVEAAALCRRGVFLACFMVCCWCGEKLKPVAPPLPSRSEDMIPIDNVSKHTAASRCSPSAHPGQEGRGRRLWAVGPQVSNPLIKCERAGPFQASTITVNGQYCRRPNRQPCAAVGMVFQHFELFPHEHHRHPDHPSRRCSGRGKEESHRQRASSCSTGSAEGPRRQFGQFPGPAAAWRLPRALAMDPICMLFDEPTSAWIRDDQRGA